MVSDVRGSFMFLVVENSTVCNGKIDPETKALVRFLYVERGLSMWQIVDRCNISRASVYGCSNGINSQKNGNSCGRPRLITARQRILERNVHKLRQEEGNFSYMPTNSSRVRSQICSMRLFGLLIRL